MQEFHFGFQVQSCRLETWTRWARTDRPGTKLEFEVCKSGSEV